MQHLALDDHLLRPAGVPGHRPHQQQIGATAAQAVLALDAPAAVDDALQKRLQQ